MAFVRRSNGTGNPGAVLRSEELGYVKLRLKSPLRIGKIRLVSNPS
jgi:hypothetical protein